jgi:hypothetical protein
MLCEHTQSETELEARPPQAHIEPTFSFEGTIALPERRYLAGNKS